MRKMLMNVAAGALLVTTLAAADAAQISGQLSLNGTNSYSSSAITFQNPANVGAGAATGSYISAFSAGCMGCVTITSFDYTTLGAITPFVIYSATFDGVTASFTINSIISAMDNGDFLNIGALGTANLTGFTATPGSIAISSQGGNNTRVTFSATNMATPVPEPISLAVLGIAMVGLGLARRQ